MGKKKSVVLVTLITIVMLVLCAIVAFPKVAIPGTSGIKTWNPAAMQYDLGAEFGGGHYAYYYPNGVITAKEYDALDENDKAEYALCGSLYLSKDEGLVADDGNVDAGFKAAFDKAVKVISDRFAARAANTGSSYRVSVVDDYAIRVDLSASENTTELSSLGYASQAFTQLAMLGEVTFETSTTDSSTGSTTSEVVEVLKEDGVTVEDLIRTVSIKTQYEISYLRITFTSKGKEMLTSFKDSGASSLDLKIGGETVLQIQSDSITSKNEVEQGVQYEAQGLYAETLCVLINSAIEEGEILMNDKAETPLTLRVPTENEIRTYAPVYGDTLIWVYVAVLVVILVACVLSVLRMNGFGVMNIYSLVSYLIIVALCFAFITRGVFVVSLGSIFVFLAGLLLVGVLNGYVYDAIKAEVQLGKTVNSSVKGGYKKTLWTVVDIYAVLLLGGVAMLLSVASLYTLACQALICVAAGAFINLLWGRVLNYLLLSASKDKYRYLRLVREDDEDDE